MHKMGIINLLRRVFSVDYGSLEIVFVEFMSHAFPIHPLETKKSCIRETLFTSIYTDIRITAKERKMERFIKVAQILAA